MSDRLLGPPRAVSFGEALKFWLKLGFISFGGPAGQIAIMQRELVEHRRWISQARFNHALNYCMLLPGPEAQQLATYIGWLMHRTRGGVAAGVLFVLPSLFILIALSWAYLRFGQLPLVAGMFRGVQCAVAAIVLQAVWRIGARTLARPAVKPMAWAVAAGSFVAIEFLHLPFPWIVLGAALVGLLSTRLAPLQFAAGNGHASAASGHAPALIDDTTPTPAHALFSRLRLAQVVLVGALLWSAPMAALLAWQGWNATMTQMGWFFTKAALLTFGGAYAVLPYVYQGAVQQFGWLSASQMMDGLALGETTPGPLIMVVAFVGFLGGWHTQVLGPGGLFAGAALAAAVATWFTFLPSFLFILVGGPLVESTHGNLRLTAPLQAITAAVVGVIASLAWFFFRQIAYAPDASGSAQPTPDWLALAIAGAAALALLRYRVNVMLVIGAAAGAGLLGRLSGLL